MEETICWKAKFYV